jgi:hypothetical protein
MTARVLTGSKAEIAQQVANLEGEVRQVIVLIDESPRPELPVPATVEEMFKEMEPYMVDVNHVDDSREAIYTRQEGE